MCQTIRYSPVHEVDPDPQGDLVPQPTSWTIQQHVKQRDEAIAADNKRRADGARKVLKRQQSVSEIPTPLSPPLETAPIGTLASVKASPLHATIEDYLDGAEEESPVPAAPRVKWTAKRSSWHQEDNLRTMDQVLKNQFVPSYQPIKKKSVPDETLEVDEALTIDTKLFQQMAFIGTALAQKLLSSQSRLPN
jgi:hypothetical protein